MTLVSDTGSTDTAYTDATATETGVRYAYRVMAIRGGERSARSDYATVMVVPPPVEPPLLTNLDETPVAEATITQQYAMPFRLGLHGQGYEISSVKIDLASVPSNLTVSLWRGGHRIQDAGDNVVGPVQRKIFDFVNPPSLEVGLNEFMAPPGAYALQNVNYAIVLSGFTELSIMETTSDDQDAIEPAAVLFNISRVRALGSTGQWSSSATRTSVLRLAIEGSRRDRGTLVSNFAHSTRNAQEIISLGDQCCFDVGLLTRAGPHPHPPCFSGRGRYHTIGRGLWSPVHRQRLPPGLCICRPEPALSKTPQWPGRHFRMDGTARNTPAGN